MFGVPPNTLPLVIYKYMYREILLLGKKKKLQYNMSVKTIAGRFNGAFWWYGPLSKDQEFF